MKKAKFIILFAIFLTIALSTTPAVVPQVGTYTFHGAAGNEKILKVRTVNNASLEDLFGSNWTDVIAFFGEGADQVGAQSKSVVTAVNFTDKWDLSQTLLGILFSLSMIQQILLRISIYFIHLHLLFILLLMFQFKMRVFILHNFQHQLLNT